MYTFTMFISSRSTEFGSNRWLYRHDTMSLLRLLIFIICRFGTFPIPLDTYKTKREKTKKKKKLLKWYTRIIEFYDWPSTVDILDWTSILFPGSRSSRGHGRSMVTDGEYRSVSIRPNIPSETYEKSLKKSKKPSTGWFNIFVPIMSTNFCR